MAAQAPGMNRFYLLLGTVACGSGSASAEPDLEHQPRF